MNATIDLRKPKPCNCKQCYFYRETDAESSVCMKIGDYNIDRKKCKYYKFQPKMKK